MTSFNELFERVKEYFLENKLIGETAFKMWIQTLEPLRFEENTAVFYVKSVFQKELTLNNYEKLLKQAFNDILGFEVEIRIETEEDLCKTDNDSNISKQRREELEKSFENAKYDYTFDTFIVGSSNEFAYAACTAVANNKGSSPTYNPLFIYGPSGLGKTHLLMAISHEIKNRTPDSNILYVSGETFSNELITAIQNKNTSDFHQKYRSADVLLVDDVQFIAGKESTQEEFFHTFNELHQVGKQIVLTSDRPPKDIKTLEERIRTRFEWGLIADISIPDFETRIAIIRRKAELLKFSIPDEVAEFIANRLKTNIRQLEGAVKKLKALEHLGGSAPSIAMAQSVIRDILNDDQPTPITVERIIGEVANIYGVSSEDIRSSKRTAQVSTARKVAMYTIRQITDLSLDNIGTEFGGRDHSTVIYAVEQVEKKIKKDNHLKEIIEDLIKNISEK